MKKTDYDDQAAITDNPLMLAAVVAVAAIMVIAFTADTQSVGVDEGDRAIGLTGFAYDGNGWNAFDLKDYFDESWEEGDVSGEWVVIEFMDTDCPYCVSSADDIAEDMQDFSGDNPYWDGPIVNFVIVASELTINGHDSSRGEIQAFRDKTEGFECAGSDCSSRPGPPHDAPYIDDIDREILNKWKVQGTPTYILIQPDGIINWISSENPGEDLTDAIQAYTPRSS